MNELLLRRRLLMVNASSAAQDPYLLQPFTITAVTALSIAFTNVGSVTSLSVKLNDGNWTSMTSDQGIWWLNGDYMINLSVGDTLQIKATGAWGTSSSNWGRIYCTDRQARCDLSGNINSLVHGDNFLTATTIPDFGLGRIFSYSNGNIYAFCVVYRDISNLRLPATEVGQYGYYQLFYQNPNITTVPDLPATTIGRNCYDGMFFNCLKLTTVQEILPATTLAQGCYRQMFASCTSITTAPILPAMTLVNQCYYQMFNNCNRLNYVKALFTTTPTVNGFLGQTWQWLSNVASTGTFVKNSAATWTTSGVSGVPNGWTIEYASN